MKTKLFFGMLVLGLLVMACNKSHDDFPILESPKALEPIDEIVEKGFVSLNPIVKDVIEITTGKALTLEEALDEMVVQIKETNIAGMIVVNSNYRDLPIEIPLAPGSYELLISNYSFSPSRFDIPVYGAMRYFSVTAGTNTLLDLELALLDAAVTINFSNELVTSYPDIAARVEYIQEGFGIGPNLNWTAADNGLTGYLDTYDGDFYLDMFYATTGTLNLEVTATNLSGTPVTVIKTYYGVVANQHYNINIEQTDATTASLTVTLNDEELINDTITFPFN